MTSAEIRDHLAFVLEEDLVGPAPGSVHENEALADPPSRFYLTGFLVPSAGRVRDTERLLDDEEPDQVSKSGAGDDEAPPERVRKGIFPSSIGLTVLVPGDAASIAVLVRWADYRREPNPEPPAKIDAVDPEVERLPGEIWRRVPRSAPLTVAVGKAVARPIRTKVADSGGLVVVTSVRSVSSEAGCPAGTRCVSVFLVNEREPAEAETRDEGYAFQAYALT